MSAVDFAKCLSHVLVYEGGKVDNPKDPGGRTNQGVTQSTFNAWLRSQGAPSHDVYNMVPSERDAIYSGSYWKPIAGDELPTGVDFVVFDAAVNSGVGRAGKWLQAALGDAYHGQIDGQLGAKTIQAIADFGDDSKLVEEFCARRLATLKRLSTFKTFGKGWTARIANGQKIALSWIEQSPEILPVDVTGLMGHQKAVIAGNLKDPPISQIATHITTAASSVSAVATQATTGLAGVTFGWVPYVLGVLACASVGAGVAMKFSADAKAAAEAGTATATVDVDADAGLPSMKPVDVAVPTITAGAPAAPKTGV